MLGDLGKPTSGQITAIAQQAATASQDSQSAGAMAVSLAAAAGATSAQQNNAKIRAIAFFGQKAAGLPMGIPGTSTAGGASALPPPPVLMPNGSIAPAGTPGGTPLSSTGGASSGLSLKSLILPVAIGAGLITGIYFLTRKKSGTKSVSRSKKR